METNWGLVFPFSMGFLHNPEGMLCVLARTLKASDRKAVLFTAAYAPLDAAVLAAATEDVPAVSMYGATEVIGSRAADAEHYKGQSDYSNILKNGVCLFGDRLFCFSGCVKLKTSCFTSRKLLPDFL